MTIKCECGRQQAFYHLDSWDKADPPRKLCCVCVDRMIVELGQYIMKDVLNLREITNQPDADSQGHGLPEPGPEKIKALIKNLSLLPKSNRNRI
ncbi:hypothetical protein LCGC14_2551750 [marine sediment metagenome]|uniref:Uncharacterized protein n=1 Tax=marine sediment metagenome TaxID=412755 RepID=A0A0F9AN99_9ZZZZ